MADVVSKKVIAPSFVEQGASGPIFTGTAVVEFDDGATSTRAFRFEIPARELAGLTKAEKEQVVETKFAEQLRNEEGRAVQDTYGQAALNTLHEDQKTSAATGVDSLGLPAEIA
jgi:hypothetical protein